MRQLSTAFFKELYKSSELIDTINMSDDGKKDFPTLGEMEDFEHEEDLDFSSFQESNLLDEIKLENEEVSLDESSDFNEDQLDDQMAPQITSNEDENDQLQNLFEEDQLQDSFEPLEEDKFIEDRLEKDEFPDPDDQEQEMSFKELKEEITTQATSNFIPEHQELENIPSFSVLISGIAGNNDQSEVLRILKEFSIIDESNLETFERSVKRSRVFIPHIGEYLAILIAHKLRKINACFEMGLSQEIDQESEIEEIQKGPVNLTTLKQDKIESYDFIKKSINIEDIIISTSPQIENKEILDHLGIIIEETLIHLDDYSDNVISLETSRNKFKDISPFGLSEVYNSLIKKLKIIAHKKNANAISNIQFQTIPIDPQSSLYKVICSGNILRTQ
jgi:uncharacterized protein YbjQ (UPF0145 family)